MTSSVSYDAILITEEDQVTFKVDKEKLSAKSKFFKAFFTSELTKKIDIEGEALPGYVIDRNPNLLEKIIAHIDGKPEAKEFKDWNEALELLLLAHELILIPYMNKCATYLAKKYTSENFAQLFKSGCLVNSNNLIETGQRFLFPCMNYEDANACSYRICNNDTTRSNCIKSLDEASLNLFLRLGIKRISFKHWDELADMLKEYWMEKEYDERKYKLDNIDGSFYWPKVYTRTIEELHLKELLSSERTIEIILQSRKEPSEVK